CVFMAGWLRTRFVHEETTFTVYGRINMIWMLRGGNTWLSHDARGGDMALSRGQRPATPYDYQGMSRRALAKSWGEHFDALGKPARVWTTNFLTLVIPLTLLSAWLLLSKPRRGTTMNL